MVSVSRTHWRRRVATCCSNWSPTGWPRVSLMVLKWSRSTNSSATLQPLRSDQAVASENRSRNSTRLGRPVSGSWCARKSMRASFALRSVMSWMNASTNGSLSMSISSADRLTCRISPDLQRHCDSKSSTEPWRCNSSSQARRDAWSTHRPTSSVVLPIRSSRVQPKYFSYLSFTSRNRPLDVWAIEAASGLARKATWKRCSVWRSTVMSCMAPDMVIGVPRESRSTWPVARPTRMLPSA